MCEGNSGGLKVSVVRRITNNCCCLQTIYTQYSNNNVYIIHKQQCVHNTQTTICTQNTSNNVVTLELSRERKYEQFTSRALVRLFVVNNKRLRKSRRQVVIIQSVLC